MFLRTSYEYANLRTSSYGPWSNLIWLELHLTYRWKQMAVGTTRILFFSPGEHFSCWTQPTSNMSLISSTLRFGLRNLRLTRGIGSASLCFSSRQVIPIVNKWSTFLQLCAINNRNISNYKAFSTNAIERQPHSEDFFLRQASTAINKRSCRLTKSNSIKCLLLSM